MIFSKIGPARPHDIVPHLFVIQVGTVNLLVALRTLSPGPVSRQPGYFARVINTAGKRRALLTISMSTTLPKIENKLSKSHSIHDEHIQDIKVVS